MEWSDDAIVLSAVRHGENAAITQLLTRAHGRHAGLVRGGAGRRMRGVLQPGNQVHAAWRARLAEHLGTLTCELVHPFAAPLLDEPARLAGLQAACALSQAALPEREPHPRVFAHLLALLGLLRDAPDWPAAYVRWELALLSELGFGLDLTECAATGRNDQLAYVSPKSGRAVSISAGEPYRARLLPLPAFLLDGGSGNAAEVAAGLVLTGHFLEQHAFTPHGRTLPAARGRLVRRLAVPGGTVG